MAGNICYLKAHTNYLLHIPLILYQLLFRPLLHLINILTPKITLESLYNYWDILVFWACPFHLWTSFFLPRESLGNRSSWTSMLNSLNLERSQGAYPSSDSSWETPSSQTRPSHFSGIPGEKGIGNVSTCDGAQRSRRSELRQWSEWHGIRWMTEGMSLYFQLLASS